MDLYCRYIDLNYANLGLANDNKVSESRRNLLPLFETSELTNWMTQFTLFCPRTPSISIKSVNPGPDDGCSVMLNIFSTGSKDAPDPMYLSHTLILVPCSASIENGAACVLYTPQFAMIPLHLLTGLQRVPEDLAFYQLFSSTLNSLNKACTSQEEVNRLRSEDRIRQSSLLRHPVMAVECIPLNRLYPAFSR